MNLNIILLMDHPNLYAINMLNHQIVSPLSYFYHNMRIFDLYFVILKELIYIILKLVIFFYLIIFIKEIYFYLIDVNFDFINKLRNYEQIVDMIKEYEVIDYQIVMNYQLSQIFLI
jgi:hypothetical protein